MKYKVTLERVVKVTKIIEIEAGDGDRALAIADRMLVEDRESVSLDGGERSDLTVAKRAEPIL